MEWLTKSAHRPLYQDDYLYLTSNCCNDNRINKTANCVSSSVDFLVWFRGGNTRMGLFGVSFRLDPDRSFSPLPDIRPLYRVSIGCLVHAAAAASVHHTYVGEDRRILASPCTGLSTDAPSFSFALCRHPFLFKQVLRSTSLAGLLFRLGLGRVMDAIGYSSGLLAPFASCP